MNNVRTLSLSLCQYVYTISVAFEGCRIAKVTSTFLAYVIEKGKGNNIRVQFIPHFLPLVKWSVHKYTTVSSSNQNLKVVY